MVSLVGAALWTAAVAWAGPDSDPEQSEAPAADRVERSESTVSSSDTPDAIDVDHAAHSDLQCVRCHGGDGKGDGVDLRPSMEVCAECHGSGADGRTATPRLRNCQACHVGYDRSVDGPVETVGDWRSVEPAPMIPPPRESGTSFDHDRHLAALVDSGEGDADRKKLCARCHGGEEQETVAAKSCQSCHGGASTNPEAPSMKPANHTIDWIQRHGKVARAGNDTCDDCHTEDDCTGCHDSQSAEPFSVHPPNFDTLHAADARSDLDNCTDCHTVETFCTRCHAETNFAPESPDRPPVGYDVHPEHWTEPNAPNNHAVMARRNIEDCASCHTERDCVSCHQGVNPHPPEFQLRCKQWLDSNPAPCAKCHGDLSAIRQKCL